MSRRGRLRARKREMENQTYEAAEAIARSAGFRLAIFSCMEALSYAA